MADNEVSMMMSVYPGAMTGFAALNAGLVSINNVFGNMTRAFDRQFDLLDTAVMTTGIVVTQLGLDAMDAFGKFEQGMKIVQMVSGQTKQDIQELSQAANQFSIQYRTDIDQITEGLQTLGRAGLNSAAEQTEVLEAGLTTAKLEGRELNSVLQELIQNTALLGGDLQSDQFGELSEYLNDKLVATSMTAPITTHDISETLKYSGGIAAAAGANLESDQGKENLDDYLAAIAAFARKGVTGSIAGTALRAFFNKPATQDSSVVEALASIKLKPEYLWEEDEETMKPISDQIGIIQGQMDKLNISTMDQLQIWSKIVGGKMGQQMMKLHAEDIKEVKSEIKSADDATSLAANSMKTYEANLKAVGEAGEALKRNVGGKLVYFVNPILEFINKITSFMNNDFGASVLATTVLAFVGTLARKIISVARIIKTELGTLLSGVKYHLGSKAGLAIGPNGELIQITGSQASGKGSKAPKNINEFSRQYYGFKSNSGIEALKKEGYTNADIARIGHFSKLTRDSTGLGVSDAEFVKRIYPHLSDDFKKQMDSVIKAGGGGSRTPFNQLFLDGNKELKTEIVDLIIKMKDLEGAATGASISLKEMKKPVYPGSMKGFHGSYTFGLKKSDGSIEYASSIKAHEENLRRAAQAARDHATATGQSVVEEKENEQEKKRNSTVTKENATVINDTTTQVSTTVARGATTVVKDINAMMRGIFYSMHAGKFTTVPGLYSTPSYVNIPQSVLNAARFSNHGSSPLLRDYRLYAMDAHFRAAMAAHFDRLYNKPGPIINEKSDAEKRIDRALAQKEYEKNVKNPNADKARADYYNRYVTQSRVGSPYAGAGGYQGRLPTQAQIDASLKANRDAEIKSSQEAAAAKQKEIEKINQEIATKQAEIDQAEKNIIADQENAMAVERMTASANAFVSVMEGKLLNKSGTGTNLIGLNDKQKKDLEGVHRRADMRAQKLDYKAANKKFLDNYKSSVKGLTVSQSEAERFREQAKQQVNQLKNMANLSTKEFAMAGGRYGNQLSYLNKQYSASPQEILRQNEDVLKRVQNNPIIMQNYAGNMGGAGAPQESGGIRNRFKGFGQTFATSFSNYLNRDRSGSLLNFAKLGANGKFANSLGGLANKALNASESVGGPFMVAIMAATFIIQKWQEAFQKYCEDLKKAGDRLSEAYSKMNEAENSLEQNFRDKYPDATDEEIEQIMNDTYSEMGDKMAQALTMGEYDWLKKLGRDTETGPKYEYDEEAADGSVKQVEEETTDEEKNEQAIKENTGALYAAAADVSKALNNYVKQADDSWWGQDGWTGWVTDQFGGFMDKVTHWDTQGSNFMDNNNEFMLTQSQADENYAGYTEMAGLMLEDFKDAGGDWVAGLRTMMGENVDELSNAIGKGSSTSKYLEDMAKFSAGVGPGSLNKKQNALLQQSMKNQPKVWKNLGKELAKRDKNQKLGRDITKNQNKIKGLTERIRATVGKGFKDSQIQRAAYIQQLQDMKEITDQAIVPMMQTNLGIAGQTLSATGTVGQNTGNTVGTTGSTNENAAIIAGLVAIIARQSAKGEHFDQVLANGENGDNDFDGTAGTPADKALYEKATQDGMDADKFYVENMKDYNHAIANEKFLKSIGLDKKSIDSTLSSIGADPSAPSSKLLSGLADYYKTEKAGGLGYLTLAEMTAKMTGYDYDKIAAMNEARKLAKKVDEEGIKLSDAFATIDKNYTQSEEFKNKIIDSYIYGDGEDDGSGSSSGSGSGSNKDNSGTKKERVDLVLCNKKEIPKLNVNLFKKPPSFTVLNKNFKLRDVKINTQDKPKAVMAAIKNSFIDIQKRTDPKIIQDEEAVYDPVAATEGNSTPSGSTGTKTDD